MSKEEQINSPIASQLKQKSRMPIAMRDPYRYKVVIP